MHPKLVFIEKPLAISDLVRSNGVISRTRLVCGSQFVLRPSFEKFFLASVDLIRLDGARIQSSFCEALAGPASAHSWNPDFKNGWITDESSGGGVLSEYSHALFWVGWLIKKNGLPLPQVQLDRHVQKMNMASKTSLVHVEMSLTSETGLFANVTQSCDISLSRKSLSVLTSMGTVELTSQSETGTDLLTWTASNGFKERVELNQSDRQADAIRLISHLNLIASHPSLDSPLSLDIAAWVDQVIDEVRNVVFNP
ncbi:MAG: hypothetical protein JW384_00893 [Nitrosomonadaceae bacterium]|nr:hypothetical protein [Nitrosomonadaceae bacterium]